MTGSGGRPLPGLRGAGPARRRRPAPARRAGASTAILASVTAFYDVQCARGGEFFIYPDYFLFHVGRAFGDHNMLDVWPDHKEVVVADDAEEILRASTTGA